MELLEKMILQHQKKKGKQQAKRQLVKSPSGLDFLTEFFRSSSLPENQPKKDEKLEEKVAVGDKESVDSASPEDEQSTLPAAKNHPSVSYTVEEEHLLSQQLYGSSTSLDYDQLFYGPTAKAPLKFGLDDDYWVTTASTNDTEAEAIETHEASEKMQDIQYAFITGAVHEVNAIDRRKFDMWIKFNKALFHTYELINGVTREIDYARHL